MTLNVISFDEGWMGISGLISLLLMVLPKLSFLQQCNLKGQ